MSSSFPATALTSDQYIQLRGSNTIPAEWRGTVSVSVCPNIVLAGCRVNGTPTGDSIVVFAYDGVFTGSMTSVKPEQTVIISRTNNILQGYYTGRVKLAPTGTTSGNFYISECSSPITDNDYVFVIEDYRIWPILARDLSGVQLKDYNISFRQLPPLVVGLKLCYAGWVSVDTGMLRISFDLSGSYPATSGSAISGWSWSVAGTDTISGSTSTDTVELDFPASDGTWHSVTVTDSGGRTTTRHFLVFAHDGDHPPFSSIDSVTLQNDLGAGWSGSLVSFGGEFVGVIDNSLVCVWITDWYNDVESSIYGNNVVFTGRLRREAGDTAASFPFGNVKTTSYELEGVGAQLARLHGTLIAELNAETPTLFDQIKNLTIWRGIVHMLVFHSTFTSLHDLEFSDYTNDYLAQALRTQGGNLLGAVNDLGFSINASAEFMPDGSARVVRDLRYRSTADRNAALIAASWGLADMSKYTLNVDHVLTTGRVDASGATYFKGGAIDTVYPFIAIAPGISFEYPEGQAQLARQILKANVAESQGKTELAERSGRHFAVMNNRKTLDVTHIDGYHFLSSSLGHYYTFTLPTSSNEHGIEITTAQRWLNTRVSLSFNNDNRTCDVTASYTEDIDEDTVGAAGDNITYPDPNINPPLLPALPPIAPYPGIPNYGVPTLPPPITGDIFNPTKIAKDGNTVVVWSMTRVWLCLNFKSPSRIWTEITPAGGATMRQCLFDPFPDAKGLWVLANDGADSFVYYAPNFVTPEWTQGDSVNGVWTELRANENSGGIEIYTPSGTIQEADTGDYDFSLGDALDWSTGTTPAISSDYASYSPHGTFTGSAWNSDPSGINPYEVVSITKSFATPVAVSTIRVIGTCAHLASGKFYVWAHYGGAWHGGTYLSGFASSVPSPTVIDNTFVLAAFGFSSMDAIWILGELGSFVGGTTDYSLTDIIISAPEFPIPDGTTTDGAAVVDSADNGEAWNAPVVVGASPSGGGAFDIMRVGTVALAGTDGQAYSATAIGSTFTSLGSDGATGSSDPTLLELPWGKIGSASIDNWSTSTPDYILGSAALVSGACLWFVDGSGSRYDITPSGVTGIPSNNCFTSYFGNRAAVIGNVSGTRHLFTTTNLGTAPTWVDRGAVGADADFVRPLRLSPTLKELFWVDDTDAKYSLNYAVTIKTAGTPSPDTLLGIEVYG